MTYDRSPLWIQELQIGLDQISLARMDRAIDELVQLGWKCEQYRVLNDGKVRRVSVHLDKTMEIELCP